eukprot:SAG31_NODE_13045_length_896_cov_1.583438_2_plen_115_part_00
MVGCPQFEQNAVTCCAIKGCAMGGCDIIGCAMVGCCAIKGCAITGCAITGCAITGGPVGNICAGLVRDAVANRAATSLRTANARASQMSPIAKQTNGYTLRYIHSRTMQGHAIM